MKPQSYIADELLLSKSWQELTEDELLWAEAQIGSEADYAFQRLILLESRQSLQSEAESLSVPAFDHSKMPRLTSKSSILPKRRFSLAMWQVAASWLIIGLAGWYLGTGTNSSPTIAPTIEPQTVLRDTLYLTQIVRDTITQYINAPAVAVTSPGQPKILALATPSVQSGGQVAPAVGLEYLSSSINNGVGRQNDSLIATFVTQAVKD